MILSLEEARGIHKDVVIHEGAVIFKGAVIHPGVVIHPGAVICADVVIHQNALINKDAFIIQGAVIRRSVEICEGSFICRGADIGALRKSVSENLVIHGIGITKNITAYKCEDGLIINIGCANEYKGLPIDEMRELISKEYDSDHEYFDAMNLIEKWYSKL